MPRFRNPRYAPEFLEKKLSPTGVAPALPVAATVYTPPATDVTPTTAPVVTTSPPDNTTPTTTPVTTPVDPDDASDPDPVVADPDDTDPDDTDPVVTDPDDTGPDSTDPDDDYNDLPPAVIAPIVVLPAGPA